ncbi:hypothetical protein ACJQWK_00462 [Exserohilum turcicum]
MAFSPLESLPNELLLEIVNQLFLESIDQVRSISLVSRRCHRLANELLYSAYARNRGDPALFIRTLASVPDLARCVRSVDWDCRPLHSNTLVTSDVFWFTDDLTCTERRVITNALVSERCCNTDSLDQQLTDLGTDAYLNLFLSFTPHVRRIRIAIPFMWNYNAIWFKPALDSLILKNLTKSHIVGPLSIRNVIPLFVLPSLQSLTLDHVAHDRNRILHGTPLEWHAYDIVFEKLQLQGSNIEEFVVQNCSIDTVDMARLMGLFRNLKTFEFEFTGHGQDKDNVDLAYLLNAVTQQKKSLTSLSLKDCRLASDRYILQELSKLEHLEYLLLDITMLCGSYLHDPTVELLSSLLQQLPRRLGRLHLIANDPDDDELRPSIGFSDALQALAPGIKNIFPALHTLGIVGWDPLLGTFTCQTKVKAMQLAFAEAGVELTQQPCSLENSNENDLATLRLVDAEEDWLWVQWVDCDGWWFGLRGDVWENGTSVCALDDVAGSQG